MVSQWRLIRAAGCASESVLPVRVVVVLIRLRAGTCLIVRRHDIVVMIDKLRPIPGVRFVLALVLPALFGSDFVLRMVSLQNGLLQQSKGTNLLVSFVARDAVTLMQG